MKHGCQIFAMVLFFAAASVNWTANAEKLKWLQAPPVDGRGTTLPAADSPPPAKPNIVIFIADDLTWHDVACFGGPTAARTPNLERLAGDQTEREANQHQAGNRHAAPGKPSAGQPAGAATKPRRKRAATSTNNHE
jgi:hypothetical protein